MIFALFLVSFLCSLASTFLLGSILGYRAAKSLVAKGETL